MNNPWGLGGKNPWKKDKKEPSLNKDEKNPWGLKGKKPWDKEETDKERIARLEKEVEDLKNDKKQDQDDSWIDKQGFTPKAPKPRKNGIGCLTWIVIIGAIIYVLGNLDLGDDKPKNKTFNNSSTKTKDKTSFYKLKIGDEKKYAICYGEVTKVHKQTGLHENNREGSIKAKETICSAYSRGEIDDYPRR